MMRLFALASVLFVAAAILPAAAASGDPPVSTANRYEPQYAVIVRILDRFPLDNAHIQAAAKLANYDGPEEALPKKVGKHSRIRGTAAATFYEYEGGLTIACVKGKVSYIQFYKPGCAVAIGSYPE